MMGKCSGVLALQEDCDNVYMQHKYEVIAVILCINPGRWESFSRDVDVVVKGKVKNTPKY